MLMVSGLDRPTLSGLPRSAQRCAACRNRQLPSRARRLYGALHMRAVIKELTRRRFHSVNSEWMLVFPLERQGAC